MIILVSPLSLHNCASKKWQSLIWILRVPNYMLHNYVISKGGSSKSTSSSTLGSSFEASTSLWKKMEREIYVFLPANKRDVSVHKKFSKPANLWSWKQDDDFVRTVSLRLSPDYLLLVLKQFCFLRRHLIKPLLFYSRGWGSYI